MQVKRRHDVARAAGRHLPAPRTLGFVANFAIL
jgi:hypothetical protein